MFKIPKKVEMRLSSALKKFQPVIQSASTRDVNETDTVTIIKDFFSDCFGYDKYSELTSEYAVRGTFCDLAVKQKDEVKILIEIKAPGVSLRDSQIKQALDYGSNTGIEWIVLTNAVDWKIFKLEFKQPIESHLISEFNILDMNFKSGSAVQDLYLLSKEGLSKSVLEDVYSLSKATSRNMVGAILCSEAILSTLRREIKKIHPDIKIEIDTLEEQMKKEVIKRDIVESEEFLTHEKKIKARKKREANKRKKKVENKVTESVIHEVIDEEKVA